MANTKIETKKGGLMIVKKGCRNGNMKGLCFGWIILVCNKIIVNRANLKLQNQFKTQNFNYHIHAAFGNISHRAILGPYTQQQPRTQPYSKTSMLKVITM